MAQMRVMLTLLLVFKSSIALSLDHRAFMRSFLGHYECNTQGRYTHEYHPLILDKAASSMNMLEDSLREHGFSLAGHMIIAGYEEQAVPSYYTDYARHTIQDE